MSRTPAQTFATAAIRTLSQSLRNPALGIGILTLSLAACGSSEEPFAGSDTGLLDAGSDATADSGTDTSPDVGPCDGPNPAGCNTDLNCPTETTCQYNDGADCRPSSCTCEPDSGWVCSADCGGRVCLPDAGECLNDSQCAFGEEWCIDGTCGECDNNSILCDIACEEGFGLPDARNGCVPCECVPISNCDGPNPAGCAATGCPSGQACVLTDTDGCVPSSCSCDETGAWLCTDDCGGASICMPVDIGECDTDDDCAVGELCDGSECYAASCDLQYDPVCGIDGQTYGNACEASLAHVEVAYEGECDGGECATDADCSFGQICDPSTETCYPGDCNIQCFVPDPVCGENGVTYTCGEVEANCNGVDVIHDGPCGDGECVADTECRQGELCMDGVCESFACTEEYDPVCGVDGNTYGNACQAGLAHVEIAHEGACDASVCEADRDCPAGQLCFDGACDAVGCPAVWSPVCGVNGETYGNECEANAAHVDVAYQGECELDWECRTDDDCPDGQLCDDRTQTCHGSDCNIECLIPDPVCGEDGVTYVCGEVEANCNGVGVAYAGECDATSCESDEDCAPGQGCFDGVCEFIACPENWDPVCGVNGVTYGNECEADAARVEIAHEGECDPTTTGVDCGTAGTCTVNEFCSVGYGGPAGSEPSYSCHELPDSCAGDATCDCVMPEPRPESECTEGAGGVTVRTFFP